MANRAYLYDSDFDDDYDRQLPDDSEYYDSRWTIPIAWWFLYDADDIKFADVHSEGSTWQSLRFVTARLTALDRLHQRRDVLDLLARDHLDLRHIDFFTAVLAAWPGRYLLMDPDEIFEDDADTDAARISPVLSDLHSGTIGPHDVLERLSRYSAIEPNDRADVLVVGCTYGPIGHKLWDQIMGTTQ